MVLSKYERLDTFKSTVTWHSGNATIDPSSNMCYIDVVRPDGSYLIQGESGSRTDIGVYNYYINTQSEDSLGVYKIRWYSHWDYGNKYGYLTRCDTEEVQICDVI